MEHVNDTGFIVKNTSNITPNLKGTGRLYETAVFSTMFVYNDTKYDSHTTHER